MTEQQIRQKFVATAETYLGCKESNGTHKKIIDLYNTQKPLPRGYAVKYSDEWCATFVSAIGVQLGWRDIILPECSCNKMIEKYKAAGRWQDGNSHIPSAGDIIMYDWQGVNGGADHTGIVAAVNGSSLKVIEGNKGEAVAYRTIRVNSTCIRGYCLPDFARKATPEKTLDEIAREVIAGKWGSGAIRKGKLRAAGYDPSQVQARVNEILKGKKSIDDIAREVIAGKWGSGVLRKAKLLAAGYNPAVVQARVNALLKR